MDNLKIDKLTVDGRRAEVHTHEQAIDGSTHRVTEHYEEIVPLEKKKRVVERIVPVVMERVTEQFTGNQVNRTVERVASEDLPMRLTELKPATTHLTAADVESIVRKVIGGGVQPVAIPDQTPVVPIWSKMGKWFKKSESPTVVTQGNPILAYSLLTLLAVQVGFIVWALFIR